MFFFTSPDFFSVFLFLFRYLHTYDIQMNISGYSIFVRNCHLFPRAERSPREGRVLTEQTPGPSHAWESQRIETRNSDRRSVNTAQVVSCLVTSNRSDERRSDKQLCLITTTQKYSPDWPSRVNITIYSRIKCSRHKYLQRTKLIYISAVDLLEVSD